MKQFTQLARGALVWEWRLWAWVLVFLTVLAAYIWHSSVFEQKRLSYIDSARIAAYYGDLTLAERLVAEAERQEGTPLPQEILWYIFPEKKLLQDLQAVDVLLTHQPTYPPYLVTKAWLLIQLKQDSKAGEVLALLEQLDPNSPELRTALTRLYSALASPSADSSPLP
jgi:hypothetical protein